MQARICLLLGRPLFLGKIKFLMSLTIQLPGSLEQQIRDNAARQGVSLEKYVTDVLLSDISLKSQSLEQEITEEELLLRIRLTVVPEHELSEYYRLSALNEAGQLGEAEYQKLVSLTHHVEVIHAERMHYVAAWARLRDMSLRQAMSELGLKRYPDEH